MLSSKEVAEELGVTTGSLRHYQRHSFLDPEFVVFEGLRFRLYQRQAVERFKRDWRRGGDGHRSMWLDAEFVIRNARARGIVERTARQKGLRLDQVEALIRYDTEERRKRLPLRSPGRPRSNQPAAHHLEWAQLADFYRESLSLEFEERGLFVEGERPPTDSDVYLAVAEHDFREHPERWSGYDHAPGDPDAMHRDCEHAAIARVRKAVKGLQIPETKKGDA